jgi:hypothetical protein
MPIIAISGSLNNAKPSVRVGGKVQKAISYQSLITNLGKEKGHEYQNNCVRINGNSCHAPHRDPESSSWGD